MDYSGQLLVFEGADGVGKSRRCRATAQWLNSVGVECDIVAFPGKLPGTLGGLVHTIHTQPKSLELRPISPLALQALHVAAQFETTDRVILPALQRGKCILLDRFWWSTWVYGVAMGANREALRYLIDAQRVAWAGIRPCSVFLIDRKAPLRAEHSPRDFTKLRELYLKLATTESASYAVHVIADEEFASAQSRINKAVSQAMNLSIA
jgi:thymidylate kinase